jgi:hypothetical protein
MKLRKQMYLFISVVFCSLVLSGCGSGSSAPENEIIETAALQLANCARPQYETVDFKITNKYIKEINEEKVFIYETECKIKDAETGEVFGPVDLGISTAPLFYATFGLVKRGEKWYPVQ